MALYRYFFQVVDTDMALNIQDRELTPLNGDVLDFEPIREEPQIFFRNRLKTSLVFTGEDYKFLKYIEVLGFQCVYADILIQQFCDGFYRDFWRGRFALNLCSINEDDCRLEFTPELNDEYTCILDEAIKQHNMLDITNIITVKSANVNTYEYVHCGPEIKTPSFGGGSDMCDFDRYGDAFNSLDNIVQDNVAYDCLGPDGYGPGTGWQLFWNTIRDHNYPTSTTLAADIESIWFRQRKITLDVGGSPSPPVGTWTSLGSLTLVDGRAATEWVRMPYDGAYYHYGNYDFLNPPNCQHIEYFVPPAPLTDIEYTRGRSLNDLLEFLALKMECFEGQVISDLFRLNSGLNPGDPDYVHGGTSQVDNLIMFQCSDVKYPVSSEAASLALISWNELMLILLNEFEVFWKVMPDGDIRVEHWSWFVKNQGLDTTLAEYAKFTARTNRYKYKKEELPSIEKFKMKESGNVDFVGDDITYSGACVSRDKDTGTVTYNIPNLTTDIGFIQSDPDKIDEAGFVMMATVPELGYYRLIEDLGAITLMNIINAPLSWANLHDKYHRHNRVQEVGTLNGVVVSFESWKRSKVQEPFTIELCCHDFAVLDFNDLIKSVIGWGEIEKVSYSTRGHKLKLTLIHY